MLGFGLYGNTDSFSLVANNSVHQVAAGIVTDASLSTLYSAFPISWCVGNIFRGNTVYGPAVLNEPVATGVGQPVLVAAGLEISGDNSTSDLAAGLINIFDQNTVSDFNVGMQIIYDGSATNSSTGHVEGFAGIFRTVLSSNFFASDGSYNSFGLSTVYFAGSYPINDDSDPYVLFGTGNDWQNFWTLKDVR